MRLYPSQIVLITACMTETMSPYEPPQMPADAPEPPSEVSAHVSVVPKVFGILHIVFGIIGLIWGIITLVMSFFTKGINQAQFSDLPEGQKEQVQEAMAPMYEAQIWDMVSAGWSLLLSALMLIAGLMLVRYKWCGLKYSNAYAWLSIAHKIFAAVVLLVIKLPAIKQMSDTMAESNSDVPANMGSMVTGVAVIVGLVMVAMMLIYPVLSLVLLNKSQSKASLKRT